MDVPEGTFDIGPKTGRLLLRTGREGVAAKVGHDLTITFDAWSGRLVLDGDASTMAVTATIETDSIKILDGTGGALPLTDSDRDEIRKTALRLLETDRFPSATFTSTAVSRTDDGGAIEGTLTIRGETVPVTVAVVPDGGDWRGRTSVKQSSFGIKPYRAFFGALRLADEIAIEVQVSVGSVAG